MQYWLTSKRKGRNAENSTSFPGSLSSASLDVGKRDGAGHVNTQNLGGKKICWTGGVAECFDCCCGKLCGFQNLEQPLKLPALSGFHVEVCR